MESGASTARVHGAPGGTRGLPRPPGPGGHAPKNRSGKKSRPEFPWRRANANSAQTMIFELAVGVQHFCRRPKKEIARARQVPRGLPRGRGTVMPKRSRIFIF